MTQMEKWRKIFICIYMSVYHNYDLSMCWPSWSLQHRISILLLIFSPAHDRYQRSSHLYRKTLLYTSAHLITDAFPLFTLRTDQDIFKTEIVSDIQHLLYFTVN